MDWEGTDRVCINVDNRDNRLDIFKFGMSNCIFLSIDERR